MADVHEVTETTVELQEPAPNSPALQLTIMSKKWLVNG